MTYSIAQHLKDSSDVKNRFAQSDGGCGAFGR